MDFRLFRVYGLEIWGLRVYGLAIWGFKGLGV